VCVVCVCVCVGVCVVEGDRSVVRMASEAYECVCVCVHNRWA